MSTPYITLVLAPGVPEFERQELEKRWRAAELDSTQVVAANYELRVDLITTPPNSKVVVTAPGIPLAELLKLQERVRLAKGSVAQVDRTIVCNYEVRIDTINADFLDLEAPTYNA